MQLASQARPFRVACGFYALVGGLVSLLGWVLDIPRLTNWDGNGISIQPNATLAAISAGTALLLLAFNYRRLAAILGVFVALIGSTVLFQYASGLDLRIDTALMFDRTWGRTGVLFPGRMGPPGATSWTLLGVGLTLAATRANGMGGRRLVVPLGLVTAAIASLSLIGYIYDVSPFFAIPTSTVIALQTSTFILIASLGLVASVPERNPARLLTERSEAGQFTRYVVPALVIVPVVLGYFRLLGERQGLYDLAFGTAARTLAEIVLLLALLWWTAESVSRQTRRRQQAEARLAEQEQASRRDLEADLADSRLLQRTSTEIIREEDVHSIYERIVTAAVSIMRAQFASMQILDPVRGQLKLLTSFGFDADAVRLWEWVDPAGHTSSAGALPMKERTIVADVTRSDLLPTTESVNEYLRAGIRAMQSTPLISRDGRLLGMLSTHWRDPHTPGERELRLLDILARQGADLIERNEARQKLLEADQRKDRFLATLAHELRNPLAPIRNAIDLMNMSMPPNADTAWARDVIDRQVRHMSRLLDDLLDVSRIVGDKLELRREIVDLRSAVQAAVELCRPLLLKLDQRIEVEVPADPIYLHADPVRLGQVFGNLLNNASKYTSGGGQILISVERDNETAVVRVRDTGIGIPKEELPRIFDLFSQVDPSAESAQGGLGIGLYLVRRLVDLHGGTIEGRSEGSGLGSEFVIRLPAPHLVHYETPILAPERPPAHANGFAQRVLIVDDNVDAATCLAVLLSMDGYDTHVAHDGLEAIQIADRIRPHAVVMDIGLPKVNGFEVCRRLRTEGWTRDTVMVAVTGWGQELDRRRSQEAGFDHHLVKPVEHAVLIGLLTSRPVANGGEPVRPGPRPVAAPQGPPL